MQVDCYSWHVKEEKRQILEGLVLSMSTRRGHVSHEVTLSLDGVGVTEGGEKGWRGAEHCDVRRRDGAPQWGLGKLHGRGVRHVARVGCHIVVRSVHHCLATLTSKKNHVKITLRKQLPVDIFLNSS